MKIGKQLMAGLLLFAFIGLVGISIQFIMTLPNEESRKLAIKESFTGNSPPVRSSDCNCIPGYIPSNMNVNEQGGIFQTKDSETGTFIYYYRPPESKDLYIINLNNTCGLNVNPSDRTVNSKNYPQVVGYTGNMGQLTCNIVKNKKDVSATFFCQSLENPADQVPCYRI